MIIPKYVTDIMERSRISNDDYNYKNALAGYTLRIRKHSAYAKIDTFKAEIDKLIKWAEKQYADAYIVDIPIETKYCNQYAVIVITDPVMQQLEKLMK